MLDSEVRRFERRWVRMVMDGHAEMKKLQGRSPLFIDPEPLRRLAKTMNQQRRLAQRVRHVLAWSLAKVSVAILHGIWLPRFSCSSCRSCVNKAVVVDAYHDNEICLLTCYAGSNQVIDEVLLLADAAGGISVLRYPGLKVSCCTRRTTRPAQN
jgi:hypothetical protein